MHISSNTIYFYGVVFFIVSFIVSYLIVYLTPVDWLTSLVFAFIITALLIERKRQIGERYR